MSTDVVLDLGQARAKLSGLVRDLENARRQAAIHAGTKTGEIKARLVTSLQRRRNAAACEVERLQNLAGAIGASPRDCGASIKIAPRTLPLSPEDDAALAIPDFLRR